MTTSQKMTKPELLEMMLKTSENMLEIETAHLLSRLKSAVAEIERTLNEEPHENAMFGYYDAESRAIRAINNVENLMRNLNLSSMARQVADVKAARKAVETAKWLATEG